MGSANAVARILEVGMERVKVKQNYRSAALATELGIAMMKHGTGSFVSTHEVVGVLDEEFRELKDEVHANDTDAVRDYE